MIPKLLQAYNQQDFFNLWFIYVKLLKNVSQYSQRYKKIVYLIIVQKEQI